MFERIVGGAREFDLAVLKVDAGRNCGGLAWVVNAKMAKGEMWLHSGAPEGFCATR